MVIFFRVAMMCQDRPGLRDLQEPDHATVEMVSIPFGITAQPAACGRDLGNRGPSLPAFRRTRQLSRFLAGRGKAIIIATDSRGSEVSNSTHQVEIAAWVGFALRPEIEQNDRPGLMFPRSSELFSESVARA